jgi:hypothetical protein
MSKKERFKRSVFFVDFGTLFDVPTFFAEILNDENFAGDKLNNAANNSDLFEENWILGVLAVTSKFFEEDIIYRRIKALNDCKEDILQLVDDRNFFVGDVTKKLNEMNDNQHGFGFCTDDGLLVGFALFAFENEDAEQKKVQLHIEYVCASSTAPKGTGLQITMNCVESAQNKFPGYTIIAFAEAKPSQQAIGFWLKKMGFELDEEMHFEGAYYPSYKTYAGNYFKKIAALRY